MLGWVVGRGRHYKNCSVIAITLHYVFALLHNALYLWRIVFTSNSYRFRLFAGIIAYDSYLSELAAQHYHFTLLSFKVTYESVIASREETALIWRLCCPVLELYFLIQNIQKSLISFALLYNAFP